MRNYILLTIMLAAVFSLSAADPQAKKTEKPIELTKATFIEKVFNYQNNPEIWKYKGDRPAIVDFYAPWCAPCRITSPVLAELAAEYGGEIYVYKIDIDKEPELARLFDVQSIPMFLFIPMDEQPRRAMGAIPKKSFKEAIDSFLLKK